jgi:1-deoxy-D-xylulose-5-phosphate reductoisomerase
MKNIVILGASGSIGTQTLDIVRQHPEELNCVGISVGRNISWLREILSRQSFAYVCVQRQEDAIQLQEEFDEPAFVFGEEGLVFLSTLDEIDTVVNGLVGFAGLAPTLSAIKARKDIALANKETLVVAGELITRTAKEYGVSIHPIDSEHSAIFQCLQGNRIEDVEKLWITASGGSFRDKSREELKHVTVDQALIHPNWSMGSKITIDSATMVNKAFEVIEAHWLLDLPYEKIEALIHPESVIHSMVEYVDGSVMAQLGTPDMRLPIQYALIASRRYPIENHKRLDLKEIAKLHFGGLCPIQYPLFYRIIDEAKRGGNRSTVVNAANEVAVAAFLEGKILFLDIEEIVVSTLDSVPYRTVESLEDYIRCDRESREVANGKIGG